MVAQVIGWRGQVTCHRQSNLTDGATFIWGSEDLGAPEPAFLRAGWADGTLEDIFGSTVPAGYQVTTIEGHRTYELADEQQESLNISVGSKTVLVVGFRKVGTDPGLHARVRAWAPSVLRALSVGGAI